MISLEPRSLMESNDAELVSQSLAGSREAFARIVAQYQSLVCSLAYSATGSLTQSEDLAQETFVIAWKQLRQLREPHKLRSWLCSIARSVISNTVRQQRREPAHAAEPMDSLGDTAAPEPLPSDRAIDREEEAILWRSLERIPGLYREPLVLFYREQQSVANVAEKLELTEDAVKQRLARGRRLLTEEVAAFVEETLARSNPGKAFTLGVLAALPVFSTSVKAASIGAAAAQGSIAAKAAASLGMFGAIAGPIMGILGSFMGTRLSLDGAQSERERRFVARWAWITWISIILFNAVLVGGGLLLGRYWNTHPALLAGGLMGFVFAYGIFVGVMILRHQRKKNRIRQEEAAAGGARLTDFRPKLRPYEYRSRLKLLGLPLVHICWNTPTPARGWIAYGETAYGVIFACGAVAVGGISAGGIAVGLISIGGFGLGLLALGGFVAGLYVAGGAAIGYVASGGAVIAWLAGTGGIAVSHNLALAGAAFAPHANDHTAWLFAQQSAFLAHAYPLLFGSMFVGFIPHAITFLCVRKKLRSRTTG